MVEARLRIELMADAITINAQRYGPFPFTLFVVGNIMKCDPQYSLMMATPTYISSNFNKRSTSRAESD